MPSSPPCLCGTSSLDPLHIVIRGRPLRALALAGGGQTVGTEGSGARRGTRRTNSNSSTCPAVPAGVGGMGWEQEKKKKANDTEFARALPVRLFFSASYPTQCCSKPCAIVCLGRLQQGGAPRMVFVQPVWELLGPSDLSHRRFSHLLPMRSVLQGFVHMA